ncbi:MAG TPA: STAS domain-containing protein [Candidatus Eisenbacteria bacterium]|jgi:anti-sigma B factor antagonist|nr:STAS domain-containing protein [Candidatus Eisenbacteria bacterium]
MFNIQLGNDGKIAISGRLDASRTDHAAQSLKRVSGDVVADCSALDYISSAGITVILELHKRLQTSGGSLRLTGMNPRVRTVFVYTGLDKVLNIE